MGALRSIVMMVMFVMVATPALAQKGGGETLPGAPTEPPPPPPDPVFDGYWEYAGSDGSPAPRHYNPLFACKDWEAARNKQGLKYKLLGTKRGKSTSAPTYMCRYIDNGAAKPYKTETGEVVNAYYICPANATMHTIGNSGLIKDHRCRCNDPAGGCKSQSPPAPENSERCTKKQPARKVTQAEADAASKKNKAIAASGDKQFLKDYKAVADEHANNTCEFAKKDLYKAGPNEVNIGYLCGTREKDFIAANNMIGVAETPPGYTWHHHEELGRMQLVDTKAHNACKHIGGVGIWKETLGIKDYGRPRAPKKLKLGKIK